MTNFYTVHVISGKENKTRDNLITKAVSQKAWGDSILQIIIPTQKEYVTKNGQRKIVDKKIFPGYLFVQAHMDDETQKLIRNTDGVSGFVNSNNKPLPLQDFEVQNILNSMKEAEYSAPKSHLKPADIVRIVSGPFSDFHGKVETYDPIKGKIKAYIAIFGRETLTELDVSEVELQNS